MEQNDELNEVKEKRSTQPNTLWREFFGLFHLTASSFITLSPNSIVAFRSLLFLFVQIKSRIRFLFFVFNLNRKAKRTEPFHLFLYTSFFLRSLILLSLLPLAYFLASLRPSSIVNKPKRKGKKIMKVNSWFVLCSLFVPLL